MYRGLRMKDVEGSSPRRGPKNSIRSFCPIHGSDHQRSLKVFLDNGYFKCFCCGEWGYLEEYREEWINKRRHDKMFKASKSPSQLVVSLQGRVNPDLEKLLRSFQENLPGSPGEEYLRERGISLEVAQQYGAGFAAKGAWPNRRGRGLPRVVFPLTDPQGRLMNIYGRATRDEEPKHDILAGEKGFFNAQALLGKDVYIVEGAFDALTLIQAGYPAVAIIGTDGMRWEWCRAKTLVLCFDSDQAGQGKWRKIAREAILRGKGVQYLLPEAYGGCKDLNELWVKKKQLPALSIHPVAQKKAQECRQVSAAAKLVLEKLGGELVEPVDIWRI